MTVEALKANLSNERKILEDMLVLYEELNNATTNEESTFFSSAIDSLFSQLEIINNSIPKVILEITAEKLEFAPLPKQTVLKTVKIPTGFIMLTKEDKEKFLKELVVEKEILNKIRKMKAGRQEDKAEFYKKPNPYAVVSSRVFSKLSFRFSNSDMYRTLNKSLKKANMYCLPSTYLAMTFFTMLIVFLVSLAVGLVNGFYGGADGLALRLLKNIGLAMLTPLIVFILFFYYPITQTSSISKKIENEMPFAIIHMSSIAGSGVEPRKIFEILARSPEYPAVSGELKKVINQVNIYGYDLVTALKNIAKATSNDKFSGLLNGIATNIVAGGELRSYLDKRASDTLLEYKLERKKYSTMAETSMDIYIGILVAAPLIFMVLLILMSVTGFGFGMSMPLLYTLLIGGIALLNIGFLIFLQIKQPG